jgi:hypothetical protein
LDARHSNFHAVFKPKAIDLRQGPFTIRGVGGL